MWTAQRNFGHAAGLQWTWGSLLRLAVLGLFGLAILFVAITSLVLLLPLALATGVALHFYIRRKLRQAAKQQQQPPPRGNIVIEAEYTVLDRR